MNSEPTVSVIISAYNRPGVVSFAIRSVLGSIFEDWEVVVVGDGCNAETEAAVRAFTDPRIRFHNLPTNTGHQSAPHNKGIELARGEFVLFLNQDDMYFPDHISRGVDFMRATGADLSWSPVLLLQHSGLEKGPVDVERDRLTVDGAVADGRFDPRSFIISSCWALRKQTCHEVGPWLPPEKTRLSPSQEWLYRAHRLGRHMAYHPYVSVLCIHSGVRRYSYLSSRSPEHERAYKWITAGPEERLALMHCVAVQEASELMAMRTERARLVRPLRARMESALERIGIHPSATQRYFEGLAKGDWVESHKRFTSTTPPQLTRNLQLSLGDVSTEDFLGRGWHLGETTGRWTSGEAAEIFFSIAAPKNGPERLQLELYGHPFRPGDRVTFTLNSSEPFAKTMGGADEVTEITLPGPGTFHLSIAIEGPTSPQRLGQSDDQRVLGYWLSSLRLVASPRTASDNVR